MGTPKKKKKEGLLPYTPSERFRNNTSVNNLEPDKLTVDCRSRELSKRIGSKESNPTTSLCIIRVDSNILTSIVVVYSPETRSDEHPPNRKGH